MQTGWVFDGDKWYYMYESGVMASNTTVDGCQLEAKSSADKLGYGNLSLLEGGRYVGMTSDGKYVFIMSEAGYGFFSSGTVIAVK